MVNGSLIKGCRPGGSRGVPTAKFVWNDCDDYSLLSFH